jgi:hypothetical protein
MPPFTRVIVAIDIMLHGDCGTMMVATLPLHGLSGSPISSFLSFVISFSLRLAEQRLFTS